MSYRGGEMLKRDWVFLAMDPVAFLCANRYRTLRDPLKIPRQTRSSNRVIIQAQVIVHCTVVCRASTTRNQTSSSRRRSVQNHASFFPNHRFIITLPPTIPLSASNQATLTTYPSPTILQFEEDQLDETYISPIVHRRLERSGLHPFRLRKHKGRKYSSFDHY